jgi:PIN domain nuclease of toxin-antitoxin system
VHHWRAEHIRVRDDATQPETFDCDWEIALKKRIRRINFAFAPGQIAKAAQESGFAELPVFTTAAALVEQLPMHHRDPFDHLLIAQAMSEPARLFTADPLFARYSELVTIL